MSVEALNILQSRKRRARLLALEIAQVLRGMGGSAHLNVLAGVLSAQRRGRELPVPADIVRLIQDVMLESECMATDDRDRLFHRPFGPDSSRWALWQGASRVDDEVDALLEETGLAKETPEAIEEARRGVLRVLRSGDRASAIDLTVLDELERRSRLARLKTRH